MTWERRDDPRAYSEAVGLLPAALHLRQADVLAQAPRGTDQLALDVGIASQDSLLTVAAGEGIVSGEHESTRLSLSP